MNKILLLTEKPDKFPQTSWGNYIQMRLDRCIFCDYIPCTPYHLAICHYHRSLQFRKQSSSSNASFIQFFASTQDKSLSYLFCCCLIIVAVYWSNDRLCFGGIVKIPQKALLPNTMYHFFTNFKLINRNEMLSNHSSDCQSWQIYFSLYSPNLLSSLRF